MESSCMMKFRKVKVGIALLVSSFSGLTLVQAGAIYNSRVVNRTFSQPVRTHLTEKESLNKRVNLLRNDLAMATSYCKELSENLAKPDGWEALSKETLLTRKVANTFKKIARALRNCTLSVYTELKKTDEFTAFSDFLRNNFVLICIRLNIWQDPELKSACEVLAKLFYSHDPEIIALIAE